MRFQFHLTLIALVATLSACSTSTVKKEQLSRVKTVAIIGLELEQQKAVSGMELMKIATGLGKLSGKAQYSVAIESKHVEGVYQDLATELSQKPGWNVLPLQQVRNHPTYAKLFRTKTEGFQQRPPVHERFDTFRAPGVLDTFPLMVTEIEELKKIARDLRVDALVLAKYDVNLNNSSLFSSLTGSGEFFPSANLNLTIIEGLSGEKIFIRNVEGPKVEGAVKNVAGMAETEDLHKKAREASLLASDLLLKDWSKN